ncbi:MAG: CDF family Co(II)/Ni(II) efflux transporter DmeF [Rubrivivax sp.]
MSAVRLHDLRGAAHSHGFADAGRAGRKRAMGAVTLLTIVTMVAELLAGWWSGSLALTADGWHMGTHALAIGGAWVAYRLAARVEAHAAAGHAAGTRYTFGGWKIEVLSAYTSGLALLVVAAWLAIDGVLRLVNPAPVAFGPALAVAFVGLVVNLASAAMLMRGHRSGSKDHGHMAHDHGHGHDHGHHDGHAHGHSHDHNFNAAYLHVLADALTSVLAIAALGGGVLFGWLWLDPAVALVGALVIALWSRGVLAGSARALVDATADPKLTARIREAIERRRRDDRRPARVAGGRARLERRARRGRRRPAAAGALPAAPGHIGLLRHVTVEVHRCPGCDAAPDVAAVAAAASSKPA